jgi:hypothetical protein
MVYRILADVVLVVHLGFVLFVGLGGLLAFRWPRVLWLHFPAAAWGAVIEFAGWPCPLTPLEKRLRELGGEAGYEGGFIDQYLVALIYPGGLTREMQIALGVAVVAVNVLIYGLVWARRRRGRAAPRGSKS